MEDLSDVESKLNEIDSNIRTLKNNLELLDSNVGQVKQEVLVVYNKVESLAGEFHDFVQIQIKANARSHSQQRLIQIQQILESRFGHYDIVRRTTTGILQANDLAIVKKDTISNATEELMISTPRYWLAPCLVALAAWINDQPDLADKALREGIKRNDEKSSLFWALVCRRADRKSAALKWTQRYLANQDEEDLDRKTVIILDAFASGLLGVDSEGLVTRQMDEWLERLSDKPGFVEKQTKQWFDAINVRREPLALNDYTYLRKYSNTWSVLQYIMEGAHLHEKILVYFTSIFEQEASTDSLKFQLDNILNSLVTDFDEEEIPLRKEAKYHQFVVDFNGDENRAKQRMAVEQKAFEEHKNFMQLLTDVAMAPESSHASVSTQKFAIALSKEWITNAYNDVTAQNRKRIPHEIEINVDTFKCKTKDGQNEEELIEKFSAFIKHEKEKALSMLVHSDTSLYVGILVSIIGLFMTIAGTGCFGIVALIIGIVVIFNNFAKKKEIETKRKNLETQFEKKLKSGIQIIRATLAEVVDFRAEFAKKDGESQKVIDFIEQIAPGQYLRKLATSKRRIKV